MKGFIEKKALEKVITKIIMWRSAVQTLSTVWDQARILIIRLLPLFTNSVQNSNRGFIIYFKDPFNTFTVRFSRRLNVHPYCAFF